VRAGVSLRYKEQCGAIVRMFALLCGVWRLAAGASTNGLLAKVRDDGSVQATEARAALSRPMADVNACVRSWEERLWLWLKFEYLARAGPNRASDLAFPGMSANDYDTLRIIDSKWKDVNILRRLFVLCVDLHYRQNPGYEPSIAAKTLTIPYQMTIRSNSVPVT
jgi:hypothetical protein